MKTYTVAEIQELYTRWLSQYKSNCTGMDWDEWLDHLGQGYDDLGVEECAGCPMDDLYGRHWHKTLPTPSKHEEECDCGNGRIRSEGERHLSYCKMSKSSQAPEKLDTVNALQKGTL